MLEMKKNMAPKRCLRCKRLIGKFGHNVSNLCYTCLHILYELKH